MKIQSLIFKNHPVLKNLKCNFGVDGAIKDVTLLIGENGCGKTRFLDELHDIIEKGIKVWNDGVSRRLTILFSDEEKDFFSLPSNLITFDYDATSGGGWDRFKIYDGANVDIKDFMLPLIVSGEMNKQFKCAYSTTEVSFVEEGVASVMATSVDNEEKPKKKSNRSVGNEIAQLLVDISSQDNAKDSKWMRENVGQPAEVQGINLDRFKKAYNNMFEGKEFLEIRVEDGAHKIFFKDTKDGSEFEISKLSSGEKQVVYRVGYLLRNLRTISGGIVLIDEPELSLHPRWQIKYINFLRELFTENGEMLVQFIIATHSPYFLKNSSSEEVGVNVFLKRRGNIVIQKPDNGSWSLFANGPTIGEVNYYAFNLPTMEFHNELYGHIQEKELKFKEDEIEAYFVSKGIVKSKTWTKVDNSGNLLAPKGVTPMTYIRHSIHHPENTHNRSFTDSQLRSSINKMIPLAR